MNKNLYIIILFCFFALPCIAQEEVPKSQERDSVQKKLRKGGLVFDDAQLRKIKPFNPLAPSKAAFYSAVLPGLGQVYNKKNWYWKVPIIYGALGSGVAGYKFFDNRFKDLRAAFKSRQAGFTTDEFFDLRLEPGQVTTRTTPEIDNARLERLQETTQNDRDLVLVVTILAYVLNIVDANVEAHLQQFNVDDNLGLDMDIKPYLDLNQITNSPNYGMALVITF